jgi:hypothetical protein
MMSFSCTLIVGSVSNTADTLIGNSIMHPGGHYSPPAPGISRAVLALDL